MFLYICQMRGQNPYQLPILLWMNKNMSLYLQADEHKIVLCHHLMPHLQQDGTLSPPQKLQLPTISTSTVIWLPHAQRKSKV